jgi:predicted acetyltransferase
MQIEVIPACKGLHGVMHNLMNLYLYDFTVYTGEDANEEGLFVYEYLGRYWTEPRRYPFLVRVDGQYAGFVLVRDSVDEGQGQVTHNIAEFFVMKKYRRLGVGREVAWRIFDRFPGCWRVGEMEENQPAQAFWRSVISEYTNGQFEEIHQEDWEGPLQVFMSPGSPSAR